MPKVIAIRNFRYNKESYKKGDVVKVKGNHVDILVRAKLVKERPPEAEHDWTGTGQAYATRHMEPSTVQPIVTNNGSNKYKAYTVLELRAEAEARKIDLPKGYVPKSELIRLLSE